MTFTVPGLARFSSIPAVLLASTWHCVSTLTRGTEGIPCLPTSSVMYVHLLASVLPPCGMTERALFKAHDIN